MITVDATQLAPFRMNQGKVIEMPESELWMRSQDKVQPTATEIINDLTDGAREFLDLACIGAGAVNQAIKAVAVARERLAKKSLDLMIQPWYSSIVDDRDRERTRLMLRLTVVKRQWS